mgnify:CR=1 FL=1
MRDKPRWEIIHGDSLTVLESFPPGTFDAVIAVCVRWPHTGGEIQSHRKEIFQHGRQRAA